LAGLAWLGKTEVPGDPRPPPAQGQDPWDEIRAPASPSATRRAGSAGWMTGPGMGGRGL